MTLIKSISGIRGTIGGKVSENLTPIDVVKFSAAFTRFHQLRNNNPNIKLVVGRDARISGKIVEQLVVSTIASMGADVINIGLSTTPTVEIAVTHLKADGGIILTASHNPKQWNALKLLNEKGEFLSDDDGKEVLKLAEEMDFEYAEVDNLGTITEKEGMIDHHIDEVLKLDLVDKDAIRKAGFKIVVDAVNSTGGMAIPKLLKALGVEQIIELYCEPNGQFPHNPEPLPENLKDISKQVIDQKADLGIVVDPDVDRLAFVMEDGNMFGEEYTLVAVADYILNQQKGNSVSNLSSTRALRNVTEKAGGSYTASAVGEINVVEKMKETQAVIGGEGNGGVIYPALHYGRDALAGTALFLTQLAKKKIKMTELRASYPSYFISKNKINLTEGLSTETVFNKVKEHYRQFPITDIDGVKIDFPDGWVHLRTSNTEPILRIYAESVSPEKAKAYADQVISIIS